MLLKPLSRFNQYIGRQIGESRSLLPLVTRKPKILKHWLITAHGAQIALVFLLVLIPMFISGWSEAVVDFVLPPVTKEALFGLIKNTEVHPMREGLITFLQIVVWVITGLVALFLLIKRLPESVLYARDYSIARETEADQLLGKKPSDSILLYNLALEWAPDAQREYEVSEKIEHLNEKTMRGLAPGAQNVNSTMVLSEEEDKSTAQSYVLTQRYEIKEQLGSGAMGIVSRAHDLRLGRDVALKQLSPTLVQDEHLLGRFRQEAKALARLSHANIVQVYDFIEADGHAWIVMELVVGQELEQILTASLAVSEVLRLGTQLAGALGYAHEQGVIHRDFKPANVLLNEAGQAKITDFGIAKIANSSLHTQLNTVMGSPAYMSPEQASGGDIDHRADIYALGIALYRMATGQLPFKGDAKAVIAQHLTKNPPSITAIAPDLSEGLDKVVLAMLEKEPKNRPQDMKVVSSMLKRLSESL